MGGEGEGELVGKFDILRPHFVGCLVQHTGTPLDIEEHRER